MSRRVAITSTPLSGSTSTTNYLWCADSICQSRGAENLPIRGYYAEGEFASGTTPQPYYYGIDQLGSSRRAFVSSISAPALSYDSFGRALQSGVSPLDFNYAGMFLHSDGGIYLTRYRAYNPTLGRWLTRDPLGEQSDFAANLYQYVGANPISGSDPQGTNPIAGAIEGAEIGTAVLPGWGTAAGIVVGAAAGYFAGDLLSNIVFNRPPDNARDPNGPKAPGKPGADEGFVDPPGGEDWVPNPNGKGYGWKDAKGNVWCPTGPGPKAHGGPHWDVQTPGRSDGYVNVYPGGRRR
jgi:RHS repeat-associated protein